MGHIASISPQVGLHPALTTKTKVSSDLCGHWVRSLCVPLLYWLYRSPKVGEVAQQHPSKIPKGKPFVPVRLRLPVYNQNFDNWPSIRRRVLITEEAGDTAALWRVSPRHVCVGVFDPFSVLGVFSCFFLHAQDHMKITTTVLLDSCRKFPIHGAREPSLLVGRVLPLIIDFISKKLGACLSHFLRKPSR